MNSLFKKLSVALVLIVTGMGAALFLVDRTFTSAYYEELSQKLNAPIAMYVTEQRQLIDEGVADLDSLRDLASHAMVINPTAEIYLLDTDGNILGHNLPDDAVFMTSVELDPIRTLIGGAARFPLRGSDPRNVDNRKVFSAAEAVAALNPYTDIRPYNRRLSDEDAETLFEDYDLILDGTDNFETRYLANRVAQKLGKPLISGALSQWEGQLSVFDSKQGTPCYQCVFPQAPAPGLAPSCAEAGVLGPLPGVVGSMMAAEAIKVIAGAGAPLRGEMLIYDALYGESRKITLSRRADCPICGLTGEEDDKSAAE